jgi:hypothetical protein
MARLIFLIFLILFLQACNGINKDNSKKMKLTLRKRFLICLMAIIMI